MILLVRTWSFILRSRTWVCDSSWSVSVSLCLLRSNVSLCALNSDTTSSPTLSVSAAVLCERARLSAVRSNIARPSRTVRRVSSSQLDPDMIACKTQFRDKRCRARSEPGGTRWRTGGEVKGKLANAVGSQYSHATSERGISSITKADAHTSAVSSRLNWRPHRFEWTRPFRGKTKSGFCACAITFRTSYIAGKSDTLKVSDLQYSEGLSSTRIP